MAFDMQLIISHKGKVTQEILNINFPCTII